MAGSKKGGLTPKQRAFVKAYTGEAQGNATKAARIAGYSEPDVQGPRLLGNVGVAKAIDRKPERPDIADPDEVRAVVTGLLRDGEIEPKDRLKAADVLTKILPGLAVATKHELSGPEGRPVQVQTQTVDLGRLTDTQLQALEALFDATSAEGQDHPPDHEG